MEDKKIERVRHREKKREMCNYECVLFHPIVPLFIVVGKVNSLSFRITTRAGSVWVPVLKRGS